MKTVKFGKRQLWMAENLNTDKFQNGDSIPLARTAEEWVTAGMRRQPAWCYYENNPLNSENHGKLYNWYTVNDARGLAPRGWRIPTYIEWAFLELEVNKNSNALKSLGQGIGAGAGTNTSGFSAQMSGCRYEDGFFSGLGRHAFFWSSSPLDKLLAGNFILDANNSIVTKGNDPMALGFSVRCVQEI